MGTVYVDTCARTCRRPGRWRARTHAINMCARVWLIAAYARLVAATLLYSPASATLLSTFVHGAARCIDSLSCACVGRRTLGHSRANTAHKCVVLTRAHVFAGACHERSRRWAAQSGCAQ
jgi:hypothetical protein